MRNAFLIGISLLVAAALPSRTRAQETYYLAVFSYQHTENRPRYAHTFATFVKARWCADSCQLESFTISWLPHTVVIRPMAVLPEPGCNFDLPTTLRIAYAEGDQVSMWGPYQICLELYQRAMAQKNRLESGCVSYKAVDTGWPSRRVSNCIHAVSDIDQTRPALRIASPGWGEPASYYVTLHLLPWIVNPCQVHEWVVDALGLRTCCIRRRDLREGNPAETAALRSFMEVTQHRLERQARRTLSACSSFGPSPGQIVGP
jgi:hypothetical protein